MSNVLIVSGSYFPYASANAICMKEFERAMTERGDKVVYAIKKHDIDTPDVTYCGGIKVYHIEKSFEMLFSMTEKVKKLKLPFMLKKAINCSIFFEKVVLHLKATVKNGNLRDYSEAAFIKEFCNRINKIVVEEEIDTIISVSVPFYSHKAVLYYKNAYSFAERIKWIALLFDVYSADKNDERLQKEELEVFRAADKIFLFSVLKRIYNSFPYNLFSKKYRFFDLPLLDLEEKQPPQTYFLGNPNQKTIVFTGTLYDDIRSLRVIQFYLKCLINERLSIHIVGKVYPENQSILDDLQEEYPSSIYMYGIQPSNIANDMIRNADIVLNIGNTTDYQFPSKIYSYIESQKPILSFYKIENDPSLSLLNKYPLALSIQEKEAIDDADVEKIKMFIRQIDLKRTSRDELKEIYKDVTQEKVCKDFLGLLCE